MPPLICCFDCKSTKNLRAIHNLSLGKKKFREVVSTAKVQKIWEQFTTGEYSAITLQMLFRLQKYKKFESNSQRLWLTYYAFRMNAKTFKDARSAVEAWKSQYQIDDATGDSYLPAENFGNFALLLAAMYKGQSQSVIQGTFNKLYDLIQDTLEADLFESPDNTPRTLAQAIKEVLNIDYNGQQRSNVLVGDTAISQRWQQWSTGDAAKGERTEDGERTVQDALTYIVEEYELNKKIEEIKARELIYRRQKK